MKGYAGIETSQPISEAGEDVAVCTIEKANSAVNRLVADGRVHQLACCVVDEMHMIGDGERGVMLELLLAKIMYMQRKSGSRSCQVPPQSPAQGPLPWDLPRKSHSAIPLEHPR